MGDMIFDQAINHAMIYEVGGFWNVNTIGVLDGTNLKACGYVNDPDDKGGETKFGIAKNSNPMIDIKNLTWQDAKNIYYNKYWLAGSCDRFDKRIAILHFDGCINHGISRASKLLQKAAGVLDDGKIGPVSISVINKCDPISICNTVCDLREQFYENIVNQNASQAKFLKGWLRRIKESRILATS
jgi:lysozyme family protein